MRVGANPAKSGAAAYSPKKLGIAIILYIPFTEGYFGHSLEIFRYQLRSIRENTSQEFDLLVFDNGSCRSVVEELQVHYEQKAIDWLILSRHNLGKAGAWNWIFASMPNELICYADSDVFFRPGWLEASLELLDAFPQAGMIAAQPNFFDVMKGKAKAHLALQGDPQYQFSEYWPEKGIIEEYCTGIGASSELSAQFFKNPLSIVRRTDGGVEAVVGATHMQFIIPRPLARRVVPLQSTKALLRTETMALDYQIDALGYLHLSLKTPYVFHMGNVVSERLLTEIDKLRKPPERVAAPTLVYRSPIKRWLARLARHPRLNPFFLRLYNFLFAALYRSA
jgi:glycosyltransferase involved in cell wall biosynthesis